MADSKITALTENTSPIGTDLMVMVDDPTGTPVTQKVQMSTVFSNIVITASPGSDHTASGIKIQLVATQAQNFGDVCYIASTGKASLGDADAISTSSCVVMLCDNSVSADATGTYLLFGIARDDTWAWTAGATVYLSLTGTTGNTLTATIPSAVNDVVQIIGIATHADRLLFNPSLVQVERL